MYFLLVTIAVIGTFTCTGQQVELYMAKFPLRNGYIYKPQERIQYCSAEWSGVFIQSRNDSCFATADGLVVSAFDLGGEFAVLVRGRDTIFTTYGHLKDVAVDKNNLVKKGSFLGLLKQDDEGVFELIYLLNDHEAKVLSRQQHFQYLRRSDKAIPCLQSEIL